MNRFWRKPEPFVIRNRFRVRARIRVRVRLRVRLRDSYSYRAIGRSVVNASVIVWRAKHIEVEGDGNLMHKIGLGLRDHGLGQECKV
jgi:hypothetical protein